MVDGPLRYGASNRFLVTGPSLRRRPQLGLELRPVPRDFGTTCTLQVGASRLVPRNSERKNPSRLAGFRNCRGHGMNSRCYQFALENYRDTITRLSRAIVV